MDPSLAVSGSVSVSVTVSEILAVMKTASDGEMADLMAEMFRGNVIFQERCRAAGTLVEEAGEEVATPVKAAKAAAASPKAPAAPKKAAKAPAKAKKEVVAAEGEEQPVAASYRLEASEIKEELCQARKLEGGVDKRWSPAVYTETQCKRKPVEGAELCQLCADCFEKESQDEKFKKWFGLITEEPESTTHMLGTTWAAKCKWVGTGAAAPASAPASPALPTGTAASPAPEEAAEDGEESAPAPAAPAPKKEVKAPAPKKEAKAPAKAKAPPKAKEAKPIVAVLPAAAAADASEPVTVAVAGELTLIGGDFYWVADGKVYSYDQIEDKQGEYKGRLTKEETIDESIAEDD